MMFGPSILVNSMVPRLGGFKHNNSWQYHSRSDHHSKIACWGILFDLQLHCALLRSHIAGGLVGYGLNHEMRDFRTGRKKNLDLVICRPRTREGSLTSFAGEAQRFGIVLNDEQQKALAALPTMQQQPVGAVQMALEAKACMTEFLKARPRLYDELNSSHQTVHGNSPHTLAVGLAMVNTATEFISPGRNDFSLCSASPVFSRHKQPQQALAVIQKLREMPRRARDGEEGFDAFAVIAINCRNDGSPVLLITGDPAPSPGDIYHYEMMILRLAQLYEQRYANIEE